MVTLIGDFGRQLSLVRLTFHVPSKAAASAIAGTQIRVAAAIAVTERTRPERFINLYREISPVALLYLNQRTVTVFDPLEVMSKR